MTVGGIDLGVTGFLSVHTEAGDLVALEALPVANGRILVSSLVGLLVDTGVTDIVCEEERQVRLASVLFRKSEVLNRHTVVPHRVAYNWCEDTSASSAAKTPRDMTVPSEITPSVKPDP